MPHKIILEQPKLCLLAFLASLVLSLSAIYLDPVINRDGILYVRAAEFFASGNWSNGFALHSSPFFSLLVALVSKTPGVSIPYAAYFINALFYGLVVLGFIAFVRALGGEGRILWWAALVILAYPFLNKFRPFIIRDVGYWAAYLWGLSYFFQYIQTKQKWSLGCWAVLTIIAALFRFEGLALLLVLPLWLWASHAQQSVKLYARIICAIVIVAAMACFTLWQYAAETVTSLRNFVENPIDHLVHSWMIAAREIGFKLDVIRREFLEQFSEKFSYLVLLLTVLLLVILKTGKALGIVNFGLVLYGIKIRKTIFTRQVQHWLGVVIVLQCLILAEFALINLFLTDRYPVALALTLLVLVPFLVEHLLQYWRDGRVRSKWLGPIVLALILIAGIESLDVRTQKQYIKDAGLWLRSQVSQDSSLYSNDSIFIYYSGLDGFRSGAAYSWKEAMVEVWQERWTDYDYFVIVLHRNELYREKGLLRRLKMKPLKEFQGRKGGKVLIFKPDG